MREKLYAILNKTYGFTMTIAFVLGFIPFIPYIVAIIIGGPTGEAIALFMYDNVYPVAFILAAVSVLIGLVAMYVGGEEGLTIKNMSDRDDS